MLSPRVLLRSRPLRQVAYFTTSKPKPADATTTTTSTTAKPAPASNGSNATKPAARPAYNAPAAKTRPQMSIPQHLVYTPSTISHSSSADASESDITTINWASSFHGISSKPVTEEQFKVLMQPLNERDIEVKPDGIIYLPEIKYRRRLNEAFGPMGWGLIPKGEAVVGDNIVTREYALIVDGRFVSQAQGENSYFSADQLPSAVEGCKSNALMRCCKDLGIASELWDPQFVKWFKKNQMEEVWVEHATTKKKRTLWYRKGEVEVAYPYRQTK